MFSTLKAGRLSRRDLLRGLAAAGIGTVAGAVDHGYVYQRKQLAVVRETVHVSGLTPGLWGLRIGFLTDLHRSASVSHDMAAAAVKALLDQKPDLIILGGDYVTWGDRRYVGAAAEALSPLEAPHGVFAALGNHDDDRDMPHALSAKGFTVLRDARTQIKIRGETLDIAGIRFWTRRTRDIAHVLRDATPNLILIAHTPSRLDAAVSLAVPLMLSGHTHGGQIVLPGLGAIAAREFPVIAGSARREATAVFVSRGVGTVYVPVRLNCPPEVAVLTLQPVQPPA